ncbi:MAG: choice-of-anchor L domain-containing protein [Bacteroidales bacterium]|nr:choice-of-anchor L domain-containing protein [Bacteroidales bacterium]
MRYLNLLALLVLTKLAFSCDYTVDLHDTYGDGWNGNTLTIQVNGVNVLTSITVATGSDASFNFSANPGDVVTIIYNAIGSWTSENEVTITSDDLGSAVYTDGMNGAVPTGGSFTIGNNCGLAPPANDDPCQTINLPMSGLCNPSVNSVNGATASAIAAPSCGSYTTQGDVWFETTVGVTGLLQIELQDLGIDATMAIYSGNCNALTEIGCSTSNSYYSDAIAPGTQLWIRVWDDSNSIGSFSICAYEPPPPPINNEPCTATLLTVDVICNNVIGTTEQALNSSVAIPSCSWGYNGGDVWYTAIVPASGFMHVNLTAAGLTDGGIAVYSGTDCNNLTEVGCSESTWSMPSSVVVVPTDNLAGQQVWIRIWEGNNDNPGTFEICLVDAPVLFTDPTAFTPQELVEDILITGCLQAFNVTYDGDPTAIGYFQGGEGTFGMASGLVMGSGSIEELTGQGFDNVNNETAQADVESDLSDISVLNGGASDMYDEAILEFDFVPSSDTTEFQFVFASAEYPTFEHTSYNDVFAFFVSGPGIAGPYADNAINVAIVPGTTDPITISTVNGTVADGGSGDNSTYFAAYTNNTVPNFNVGGYTVPITAVMAGLTPCETYHIKFAIADAGDGSLSSFVFFEESSFSSGGDVIMSNVSNVGQQNDIYEGCENYYVFSRLDTSAIAMQDTVPILLNVGGTAIEGIDYTNIPDTLFILPNQLYDTLFYSAFFDNIVEGTEYIIFSLLNGCPCSLTSTDDTIWIYNNYHLDATIVNDQLICFGDSAEITTTVNPNIDPMLITYSWSNGNTNSGFWDAPTNTTTYEVTITNICESNTVLNADINVVPTINPMFVSSKDTVCVGEPTVLTFTGSASSQAHYNWDFGGADPLSSNSLGPHNVSWVSTGLKTIQLNIDDQSCLNDTSFHVYVKEYNNMDLQANGGNINCNSNCDGYAMVTANIGVSPYSYIWENGQTTQTATQLCPGAYSVTVMDAYGCKDTSHVIITSPPSLNITSSSTAATCYGFSDGSAEVSASGGTPPYSYQWNNNQNTESIINLPANTYAVTVFDANGCSQNDNNIVVTQPESVKMALTGTQYNDGSLWICIGQTETLSSSVSGGVAPYQIDWNTGESANSISVNPALTEVYSAKAIDSHGCESETNYISVNVFDPISFYTNLNDNEICLGESIDVNIDVDGGNHQYTYILKDNSGNETVVSEDFVISPEQSQTYEITINDACGSPTETKSIDIVVHNPPTVSFSADKNSGCPPLEVQFNEMQGEENASYYWTFTGDNAESIISLDRNPNKIFKQSGSYDVSLSITSEFGCESKVIKHNYLHIFDNPIAEFTCEPQVKSILDPTFFFANKSKMADVYQWWFSDLDSSQQVNPEYKFPDLVSTYNVTLIAISRYGCADTLSQQVRVVDEVTYYAPTAFTPDGDGKNEVFNIKGNGILDEGFELIVYDRWGMEIFKTNDRNKGWNGKSESGHFVKPDVYTFIVHFTDSYYIKHEKSGHISVIY